MIIAKPIDYITWLEIKKYGHIMEVLSKKWAVELEEFFKYMRIHHEIT